MKVQKDDQEQQTTRKKLRQAVSPPLLLSLPLFLYISLSHVVFRAAEDTIQAFQG